MAALSSVAPELFESTTAFDNWQIALRGDADPRAIARALRQARDNFGDQLDQVVAETDEWAVRQLKFAELLPLHLSIRTVAERMSDQEAVTAFLKNQRIL